ncbi:NAD(P)-binding domain-containing protein [Haloplanus litoreus]|uniref:NAD(P)-binding domain-containing protein n=1 Tax=Haloplanus litoreus TaxID=767515 RepID=A0ABD6A2A5_9EURY
MSELDMADETIAFVGLGIMGGPMAKNLLMRATP